MVDNSEYGTWEICSSINDAAFKSDAIVLLTEWQEFHNID